MAKSKTYPIGTKIKYVGPCKKCNNQIGKVVGIKNMGLCIIILLSSTCGVFRNGGTMMCVWDNIIPTLVKNQQLLFSFMTP